MSGPPWARKVDDGVTVAVAAQPGAKRTGLAGTHGDALKIKVSAPPVDGAANEELGAFLAALCGVKVRDVELVRGATSRQKVFLIRGVTVEQVVVALGTTLTQNGSPSPS